MEDKMEEKFEILELLTVDGVLYTIDDFHILKVASDKQYDDYDNDDEANVKNTCLVENIQRTGGIKNIEMPGFIITKATHKNEDDDDFDFNYSEFIFIPENKVSAIGFFA